MKLYQLILWSVLLLWSGVMKGQNEPDEEQVQVTMTFKAIEGGVHAGVNVRFYNPAAGDEVKAQTDGAGKVVVLLQRGAQYEVYAANRSGKQYLQVPDVPRGRMNSSTTYSRNEMAMAEKFRMDAAEQAAVDRAAAALPDTTWYKASDAFALEASTEFTRETIRLTGFDGKPLAGELVTVSGRKNKKHFKGYTGADGSLTLLLPKGDLYDVNFKYHKNYDLLEYEYTRGTAESTLKISYIGTKQYERLQAEKKRKAEEEKKRQEEEKKRFEEERKRQALSLKQALERQLKAEEEQAKNGVLTRVLTRNKWDDKLIVCDLTGSMHPYGAQLLYWFKLYGMKEPNVQVVLFNDETPAAFGHTNNWYYAAPKTYDSLAARIVQVHSTGCKHGCGYCEENDIEALYMAQKIAKKPFREIILVADNNSPVYDMKELEKLKLPVHVVLCGSGGYAAPDYLRIAWKTKGSVHTIEEDIVKIAKLLDGQEITVDGKTYRLMKGEFIPVSKI